MLSALSPLLYIKVAPDHLTVRNVKTGAEISEVPEIAMGKVGKKAVVLAAGSEARVAASTQSAELVNPFNHPRTLLGDFTVGEQLLKAFVRRINGQSWLALAPRVVMHPLGSPAGGFTQVERRAFREMALGAGASQVVLWVGRELSDQEVQSAEVLAARTGGSEASFFTPGIADMTPPSTSTLASIALVPLLGWRIYARFRRASGCQRIGGVCAQTYPV